MTEQLGPQVQLVYNEQAYVAPLAEVAPNLDPATAGDAEIIEAVAYHWDIPVTELSKHQVTRPATGHVLVSEKAVFGMRLDCIFADAEEAFTGEFDCDITGGTDEQVLQRAVALTGQNLPTGSYAVLRADEGIFIYPKRDWQKLASRAMTNFLWRFLQDEYDIATKGHLV